MELDQVISDVVDSVVAVDRCGTAFKQFQRGVGPYGEPQLLAAIARYLNTLPSYDHLVRTKRTPDLLIPGHWALEFKLVRPFGDKARKQKIGR